MKFCMECGTPAEDSQKYCRACGHKLPELDQSQATSDEETEIVLEDIEDEENRTERVQYIPANSQVQIGSENAKEENGRRSDSGTAGGAQQEEKADGSAVHKVQKKPREPEKPQDPVLKSFTDQAGDGAEDTATSAKKPLPVLWIGVAAVVLVLCIGAGSWLLLHSREDSSEVLIGGQSFSVSQTEDLEVEEPSEEDWKNIASLTNLTSLTIRGDGTHDAVTAEDLQQLSALSNLTDLELDGVQLESVEDLKSLKNLEVLALRNAGLDSEQCASLPELKHLTTLDLSDNNIQDVTFLSKYSGLKELDLSDNAITDYTPVSACADLRSLAVDRCQTGVVGNLNLEELAVAGERVKDLSAFLEEQKKIAELYDNIVEWFNEDDFETVEVALKEYTSADGVLYANGWLMDFGSDWEAIRKSLPEDTMMVVSDENGVYYGQMAQDQRSGQGTQYLPESNSWYRGSWSGNLPNGTGSYYEVTSDGKTLEFAGTYVNGYEDGSMTLVLHDGSNVQSVAYTSQQGTRTTLQQLSDTQYAFAYLNGSYWCDTQPGGHGVPLNGIVYQQEQSVAGILPDTENQAPVADASASSSSSSEASASSKAPSASSSKSSGTSGSSSKAPAQQSAPAQTPAPATPAPTAPAAEPEPSTSEVPDIPSQEELQGMMQDAEDYAQKLLEGLQ